MVSNLVWEICERMAEVQAMLHDHVECGKHSAADVVAKARPCCRNPSCCGRCSMSATSRRTRRRSASRFHNLLSSHHAIPLLLPAALGYRGTLVMQLDSTITCPKCGHQAIETMPTDACQFFYNCKGCNERLRPKPGDCCVFCSYGSVPCPPIQAGDCCS